MNEIPMPEELSALIERTEPIKQGYPKSIWEIHPQDLAEFLGAEVHSENGRFVTDVSTKDASIDIHYPEDKPEPGSRRELRGTFGFSKEMNLEEACCDIEPPDHRIIMVCPLSESEEKDCIYAIISPTELVVINTQDNPKQKVPQKVLDLNRQAMQNRKDEFNRTRDGGQSRRVLWPVDRKMPPIPL